MYLAIKLIGVLCLAAGAVLTSIDLRPGSKYRLKDLEETKEEELPSHSDVFKMLFQTKP